MALWSQAVGRLDGVGVVRERGEGRHTSAGVCGGTDEPGAVLGAVGVGGVGAVEREVLVRCMEGKGPSRTK